MLSQVVREHQQAQAQSKRETGERVDFAVVLLQLLCWRWQAGIQAPLNWGVGLKEESDCNPTAETNASTTAPKCTKSLFVHQLTVCSALISHANTTERLRVEAVGAARRVADDLVEALNYG